MGHESRLNPFSRQSRVPEQPLILRDLYGRALSEGDGVHMGPHVQPVFRLIKVAPMLQPNAPPNMMMVTLACTMQFLAPRNQNNNEFIRVMTAMELQQMQGPKGQISVERPEEKSAEVTRETPDEEPVTAQADVPREDDEDPPPPENFYPPDPPEGPEGEPA